MLGLRPSVENVGEALEFILGFFSGGGVMTRNDILNVRMEK